MLQYLKPRHVRKKFFIPMSSSQSDIGIVCYMSLSDVTQLSHEKDTNEYNNIANKKFKCEKQNEILF